MTIKEIEELLSISRSNIRFYEKEGLLDPKRKENNYRDYSEQDVAILKKVLVLRKLGFTIEEIALMQKGECSFDEVIDKNIKRLEQDIASLNGALEMTRSLSKSQVSFETIDQDRLWDDIRQSEHRGQSFTDICQDYLMFELDMFQNMWRYIFFYDFKGSYKKYGVPVACGLLFLICIVRGISKVVLWHESFWSGFWYPFILFAICSIIVFPVYFLSKKYPKIGAILCTILLILAIGCLAFFVLLLIYGLLVMR